MSASKRSGSWSRVVVWLACTLSGCATNQFDGQVFRSGEIAFRVGPVPGSWRQVSIDDSALAFRDDAAGTTVAINGRCGKDAEDVPLAALTQHLFLQFTDRAVLRQELVPLDGREALVTELDAALDGVQKRFLVVVLKKDNCVYDLMHIAADDEADTQGFEAFYQGFATVE
jgi:hypothetical protein